MYARKVTQHNHSYKKKQHNNSSLNAVSYFLLIISIAMASYQILGALAALAITGIGFIYFYYNKSLINLQYQQKIEQQKIQQEIQENKNTQLRAQLNKAMQNEKRYWDIVNGHGELVILKDSEGKINFVNDAFCKMFNVKREQISGKIFKPPIIDEIRSEQSRYNQTLYQKYDQKLMTPRGQRWFAWQDYPRLDVNGKTSEIHSIGIDITERKQSEIELQIATDEAEIANRSKSMFLATMSHEIRTPMNGIIGMTDLLLKTPLSAEQQNYARTVKKSGDTLLSLIDEILDFSKIEAGKLKIQKNRFDIYELVQGVSKLLSPKTNTKEIELSTYIDPRLPQFFNGDEKRLRQIIINLAGNAIKFTDRGGVSISLEAEAKVSQKNRNIDIICKITDTGIGLPDSAKNSIFQDFEQADPALSRKYGGTGLGLAISKKIIEMMNGTIAVESQMGKGSCFYFRASLETADKITEAYCPKIKNQALLILSDQPIEAFDIARYCHEVGAKVMVCTKVNHIIKALEQLQKQQKKFKAVICDTMFCEAVIAIYKKMPEIFADIDISFMTLAHNTTKYQISPFDANFTQLVKPVTVEDIIIKIFHEVENKTRYVINKNPQKTDETQNNHKKLPLNILLAEDNEINAILSITVLKKFGHKVTLAHNGEEVLRYLRKNSDIENIISQGFDLVLMDMRMPVIDGLEATVKIRSLRNSYASIPVIALTANALTEDRQACIKAGMNGYLSKPFEHNQLQKELLRCSDWKKRLAKMNGIQIK